MTPHLLDQSESTALSETLESIWSLYRILLCELVLKVDITIRKKNKQKKEERHRNSLARNIKDYMSNNVLFVNVGPWLRYKVT